MADGGQTTLAATGADGGGAPPIRRALCLGGGVIGSGWAARLALAGIDVTVYDPAPAAGAAVQNALNAARRVWGRLSLAPPPPEGAVQVLSDAAALPAALAQAQFVQESLPEREDVKQTALRQIEPHLPPDAIIASSTSGLLPSRLQTALARPQRFCVAHPFTPVYLLPLVEICGGDKTSEACKTRAAAFYESIGMLPLLLRQEIDGFVADRLMEALWREALWLVNDDVATAAEIDDAIRLGCGLRWAFMGPFLTYRLGGGEGGMRHFMQQFAPALKLPWTKLMHTPDMSDELLDKIVAQSDAQAGGAGTAQLTQWRDDCLAGIMQALAGAGTGVGRALAATERLRYAGAHGAAKTAINWSAPPAAPLQLHISRAQQAWCDYNGHITESRYLQMFGDATDALLAALGADADYVASGGSYFTVETHLRHLTEAHAGDALAVHTQALGGDDKKLHIFHTMRREGDIVATAEHLLLHVQNRRAAPAAPAIAARVLSLIAAHAALPAPAGAARRVGERMQNKPS